MSLSWRELYGVPFGIQSSATTNFRATQPIAGEGYLLEVVLMMARAVATAGHGTWRLNLTDAVPTDEASFSAGEPLFPLITSYATAGRILQTGTDGGPLIIPGPFAFVMGGRRIAVSLENTSSYNVVAAGYFVWQPAEGVFSGRGNKGRRRTD